MKPYVSSDASPTRAQAKEVAAESAAAEARAAAGALRAVEAGIALYAERRDYLKLKDIAEASDVAGKVRAQNWLSACLAVSAHPSCLDRFFSLGQAGRAHHALCSNPPCHSCACPVEDASGGEILWWLCMLHDCAGSGRSKAGCLLSCCRFLPISKVCLPVLAQALDAAKAAVTGWEAGSVASRRGALDAAKVAAEFSQLCHKFMRSVHRT